MHNQRGSTLIEAMVAILVLTIGILTTMAMQVAAINASSTAMNRTEANNVSQALLETLKNLDFNNTELNQTNATVAELTNVNTAQQVQNLITAGRVRTVAANNLLNGQPLQHMQNLIQVPLGAAPGTVIDMSGVSYRLAWAVRDLVVAGETWNKTIWVFMTWGTAMGQQNQLQITTIRFNNT